MDYFNYRDGHLHAEDVSIASIVDHYGSPLYIYSRATLERHWHAFNDAFSARPHLICFAVKANSNLAVLNVLARLGSGFDIVSVGELERVIAAGGDPGKVLFSGVGKQADEMRRALQVGIRCFNVESAAELELLNQIAGEMQTRAPVSLRVNPDVDAKTHPYISTGLKENKFGMTVEEAKTVFHLSKTIPHLHVTGISAHIGSQITQTPPFVEAVTFLSNFIRQRREEGFQIESVDIGGGLGIAYNQELSPTPEEYAKDLIPLLKPLECHIILEPGRAIVGNAGILITKVLFTKQNAYKHFTVVDAAMTDCIRPALYNAYHEIIPVKQQILDSSSRTKHNRREVNTDVVGPVCESSDFLARNRTLTEPGPGDLLAVLSAGAYGFVMASHYNSRPKTPEVLVNGSKFFVIRKRETYHDLIRGEEIQTPAIQANS